MSHRLGTSCGKGVAAAKGGTAPSRLAVRKVRGALLIAMATLLALLWISPPATADPCAITDPECITDQVEGTVDDVEEAAGGAADTVTDTAEDAAETVQGIVNDTTDKAKDIIDGLLGGGDKDPGDDKGKDAGKAGGGSAGAGGRNGLGGGLLSPRDPRLDTTASGGGAGGRAPTQNTGPGGGLGRGFANGVRDLAFPLLLVGLVLGFVALQNRLDRRDPRLAAAPLGPDFLTFE